jgi:prepilin-type N-terminal cleavage/methylation domain-containing protein
MNRPLPEIHGRHFAPHPVRHAFTLIELLVVIAIIGILAALLLPVLGKAKGRAQGAACLNQGKQMMTAMLLYTTENNELFPPNPDDGNTNVGYNWCPGSAGIGGPQEFDPDVLEDPARSLLIGYLGGNANIFRCPADQRMGPYQGTKPAFIGQIVPAARTFSMSQAVGTIDPGYDATEFSGSGYVHSGAARRRNRHLGGLIARAGHENRFSLFGRPRHLGAAFVDQGNLRRRDDRLLRQHRPGGRIAGLEAKAKKTGASKIYIDDLQEEFARDFIYPIIQAGAIYEGQYFLGTSIARPLIAKRMVEIAKKEKADAIAHGATGKGNDQVRFELTAAALAPELQVIAPWRDASFRTDFPGRQEMIDYCARHKIPVQASAKKPFSSDRNLLHISYEAGILEDPWMDAERQKVSRLVHHAVRVPRRRAEQTGICRARFREGQLRGRERKEVESARRDEDAEQNRRQTRRRARGHGGEPVRGHEIAGRV